MAQVFPLMQGGSLQTRLDLTPRDVTYLTSMGHFVSAPKPLTWRQKLRAVSQALEALLYLHGRAVLHRDVKVRGPSAHAVSRALRNGSCRALAERTAIRPSRALRFVTAARPRVARGASRPISS